MEFDLHAIETGMPQLAQGLITTFWICGVSLTIGVVLGFVTCLGKLFGDKPQRIFSKLYINIFRTVPEIVIIFWIYTCLPIFFNFRLSSSTCAVIALSLYAGAYLAEIFRAGILAVPRGQIEAGHALSIPAFHLWRRVILPPAIRRMMPAFVGFLTELVKVSSLLSTIAVGELFYQASILAAETFRYVEMITTVAGIYFLMIFPLSMLARNKERRLRAEIGN